MYFLALFCPQSDAGKDPGSWPALSEMAEKAHKDEAEVSIHRVMVKIGENCTSAQWKLAHVF